MFLIPMLQGYAPTQKGNPHQTLPRRKTDLEIVTCMYAYMHLSIYLSIYLSIHLSMHVCMYLCMCQGMLQIISCAPEGMLPIRNGSWSCCRWGCYRFLCARACSGPKKGSNTNTLSTHDLYVCKCEDKTPIYVKHKNKQPMNYRALLTPFGGSVG